MASNRNIKTMQEDEAVKMIVTEIARIMTVSASVPLGRDMSFHNARQEFFARVNMKENEAVVARWKAFRSECIAKKALSSQISLDILKEKRIFDFTNTNLIRFLNSSANVSTSSTTELVTYVLRKTSNKVITPPVESVSGESKKRPLDAITQPENMSRLVADEAAIITDLSHANAVQAVKMMRFAKFFDEQRVVLVNQQEALKLREQMLQDSIAKIQNSINK